jgi:hypothetical protein
MSDPITNKFNAVRLNTTDNNTSDKGNLKKSTSKTQNLCMADNYTSCSKVVDKPVSKKQRTNELKRKNKLIQGIVHENINASSSSQEFSKMRDKHSFGSLVSLDKIIEQS